MPGGGRTWWAHYEFTGINIERTILRKKIEDVREAGATLLNAAAFTATNAALLPGRRDRVGRHPEPRRQVRRSLAATRGATPPLAPTFRSPGFVSREGQAPRMRSVRKPVRRSN